MPTEISLSAPAKINLTLDVGARRLDGYHNIRSVMQTIGLSDTVTVGLTPDRPGVHLEVTGEEAFGVPTDESNLVYRAAVRLHNVAAARGLKSGLHIRLEKRIPSQAGLGGGSSDAAATLRATDKLLGLNLELPKLEKIGKELGSDVPYFLTGGTALVEGLGERVTPLPSLSPTWDLMIVKPPVGISTAGAYAALDAHLGRAPGLATAAWLEGEQTLQNDFMPFALSVPEVAAVFQVLQAMEARVSGTQPLLCGSGSALFCRILSTHSSDGRSEGLRRIKVADETARQIRLRGLGRVWLTRTIARGEG